MNLIESRIHDITKTVLDDYKNGRDIDKLEILRQPDRDVVQSLVDKLMRIVFPGYLRDPSYKLYTVQNSLPALIEDVTYRLYRQIVLALDYSELDKGKNAEELDARAQEITVEFFRRLPEVRAYVATDLEAFYEGDPAATSPAEIIIAYPGIYAIITARLAHVLYEMQVPLIPRIMTEYAHGKTGIDIHPGATIGKYFFIDHGTGIVVGETTVIGESVKIYQGVTLGAISTRGGQSLRGSKRHPTIEDRVTIYANAAVLGGETVIGHDSVIGGNVFITHSIAPNTRVNVKTQELSFRRGGKEITRDAAEAPWYEG